MTNLSSEYLLCLNSSCDEKLMAWCLTFLVDKVCVCVSSLQPEGVTLVQSLGAEPQVRPQHETKIMIWLCLFCYFCLSKTSKTAQTHKPETPALTVDISMVLDTLSRKMRPCYAWTNSLWQIIPYGTVRGVRRTVVFVLPPLSWQTSIRIFAAVFRS